METRGLIVLVTWICVTILSAVILLVTEQLDLWTALFILFLISLAGGITFAIPFELQEIKQPAKLMEEQIAKIIKQLEELTGKVDYIRKQLEE